MRNLSVSVIIQILHFRKWSKPTLDHIFKLWNEGHAREAGISLLPIINLTEENITEPPAWTKITLGFHVLSDSYLKKLSKEHGKTYRYVNHEVKEKDLKDF